MSGPQVCLAEAGRGLVTAPTTATPYGNGGGAQVPALQDGGGEMLRFAQHDRGEVQFGVSVALPESAAESEGPPEWVHLLPLGSWPERDWTITPETCAAMQRNFEAGLPASKIIGNFNHERRGRASGSMRTGRRQPQAVEARADGLYIKPDWSRAGKEALANKDYLGISGEWAWDFEDRKGRRHGPVLLGWGLTNDPFFAGEIPFLAEEGGEGTAGTGDGEGGNGTAGTGNGERGTEQGNGGPLTPALSPVPGARGNGNGGGAQVPALQDSNDEMLRFAQHDRGGMQLGEAVPYQDHPAYSQDLNREWNADEAIHRLRRKASSDGSGDKAKMNWGTYGTYFAWRANNPSDFEDFKGPLCDVIGGRVYVIWHACSQLSSRVMGMGVAESDKAKIRETLARYYAKFGKTPYWIGEAGTGDGNGGRGLVTAPTTATADGDGGGNGTAGTGDGNGGRGLVTAPTTATADGDGGGAQVPALQDGNGTASGAGSATGGFDMAQDERQLAASGASGGTQGTGDAAQGAVGTPPPGGSVLTPGPSPAPANGAGLGRGEPGTAIAGGAQVPAPQGPQTAEQRELAEVRARLAQAEERERMRDVQIATLTAVNERAGVLERVRQIAHPKDARRHLPPAIAEALTDILCITSDDPARAINVAEADKPPVMKTPRARLLEIVPALAGDWPLLAEVGAGIGPPPDLSDLSAADKSEKLNEMAQAKKTDLPREQGEADNDWYARRVKAVLAEHPELR